MGKNWISYFFLLSLLSTSDSFQINKLNFLSKVISKDTSHSENINSMNQYIETPIKINDNSDIFNPFKNLNSLIISQENIDTSIKLCKEPVISSSKPFYLKSITEIINEIKSSFVANAEMNPINSDHITSNKIPIHPIDQCSNHLDNLIHKINFISNFDHTETISKPLIKFSSSLLPAMDGIAHHVLTLNQNFINYVLNNDALPLEVQKKLVLFSIQAAQNGDNTGSAILEFYYKLVDHLM